MIALQPSILKSRHRLFDGLFVALLILYTMAGVAITPFHGDESTIIAMSVDFHTLISGHAADLTYHNPAVGDPSLQELRMINGNLSGLGYGLMWTLAGLSVSDLNTQWDWSTDYQTNLAMGHRPSPPLLFVTRLWAAFCTSLSIAVMFAIGRRLGGRRLAWLAALCFTLLPAMLVNGRRANFEGTTLLTTTLAVLAAVILAQRLRQGNLRWIHWLLFGAASGLALASKHNSLLILAPMFAGLLLIGLLTAGQRLTAIGGLFAAGIVMIAVFFAFDPAWWSLSPELPREILRLRSNLLRLQTDAFGGFAPTAQGWWERISAGTSYVFAAPQYYEVNVGWNLWIADEIARYEASGLIGLIVPAAVWLLLALVGLITLRHDAAGWLLRGLGLAVLIALILVNPLPWQRYYLPLAPFAAIFSGAGISYLLGLVIQRRGRVRTA
ncbi:MAG: glycosyltransferase family 39 protein [Anaerolineae bacterium]|nr:glycosyltransferase family 39 protein [Anaerolineae bacterium]